MISLIQITNFREYCVFSEVFVFIVPDINVEDVNGVKGVEDEKGEEDMEGVERKANL